MTWHQLSYASSGRSGDGAGGWGVLDADPGMPSPLRELLEQGVVARLDSGQDLDDFAPQALVRARVRTLSFRYDPMRGAGWWHACQAGNDVTGRPGNVFTHAAGTQTPARGLRPITLVRSSSWLMPFGHREVDAAKLGAFHVPDVRGPNREVLARAFADGPRTEALLAAVSYCFQEDRPLLLLGSTHEVVDALERISWMTSGVVSCTIPFTTHLGVRAIPTLGSPFMVVGLPSKHREDALALVAARETHALVFDLAWVPEEVAETAWELGGQKWDVDHLWQDAFYTVSEMDLDTAALIAGAMDEVCADLRPEDLLSPSWPLALAVLGHLGEAYPERDDMCAEWARTRPWDGLRDPRLRALLGLTESEEVLSAYSGEEASCSACDGGSGDQSVVQALEAILAVASDSDESESTRLVSAVRVALGLAAPSDAPGEGLVQGLAAGAATGSRLRHLLAQETGSLASEEARSPKPHSELSREPAVRESNGKEEA
ncbi:GAP1-N2 domain-containing protein [Nocardioides ochotonae]|uniref:GAP1-N2 domain-containing protein n=1 Tax=Nocardioides ochotonae TaxID=2685869 RepID=UPI00140838E3|nr:hypothetical protein [Nocardioides ochotonae]